MNQLQQWEGEREREGGEGKVSREEVKGTPIQVTPPVLYSYYCTTDKTNQSITAESIRIQHNAQQLRHQHKRSAHTHLSWFHWLTVLHAPCYVRMYVWWKGLVTRSSCRPSRCVGEPVREWSSVHRVWRTTHVLAQRGWRGLGWCTWYFSR